MDTATTPPSTGVAPGSAPASRASAPTRRYAPYARPPNYGTRRLSSFTERVLDIGKQLSKPIFGRSSMGNGDDALLVPWRAVDRETAELREELYLAQREAAEFDEKQRQEEASLAAASKGKLPEAAKAPKQPQYESVFETARKIAERRASEMATPSKPSSKGEDLADTEEGTSRGFEESEYDEEADNDFQPNGSEDDDEEEQLQSEMEPIDESEEVMSPVPSTNTSAFNVSSAAESASSSYISHAPAVSPSILPPAKNIAAPAFNLSAALDADNQPIEVSVAEEEEESDESEHESESEAAQASASEAEEPEIEEPQESSSSADKEEQADLVQVQIVQEEIEEEVEEEIEEEIEVSGNSSGQEDLDSDQATEELASIASDEEQGEEREYESDAEGSAATSTQELDQHTSDIEDAMLPPEPTKLRGWWPFNSSGFFRNYTEPRRDSPSKENTLVEDNGENRSPDMLSQKRKSSRTPSKEHVQIGAEISESTSRPQAYVLSPGQGQRRLPLTSTSSYTSRPYVPSSFVDLSREMGADANGKRLRAKDNSEVRRASLMSSRRHTSLLHMPATPSISADSDLMSATPSVSANTALKARGQKPRSPSATPLITASSLGLEARRGAARGNGQQLRRRTCLYYGSGYGSRSVPYAFSSVYSAPAATGPSFVTANLKSRSTAPSQGAGITASKGPSASDPGVKSSITAQKILDIIGEVPPARSQAGMDTHDFINPYELSSPYSVRMRPKTIQRRRELVPLSMRLSQATNQPSSTKAHPDANASKNILESIQSAAPPEVQARLGAVLKGTTSIAKAQNSSAILEKDEKLEKAAYKSLESAVIDAKKSADQAPKPTFKFIAPKGVPNVVASSAETAAEPDTRNTVTPPPPAKALFSTPAISPPAVSATAAAKQPLSVNTPSKIPLNTSAQPAKKLALDIGESSLPAFVFTLPSTSHLGRDPLAKERALKLDTTELPKFVFNFDLQPLDPSKANDISSFKLVGSIAQSSSGSQQWECSVCELKNPNSAIKCTVCDAEKPAPKPSATFTPAAILGTASSWSQEIFAGAAPKTGEWTCAVCDLKSPDSATKCTVCDAEKPTPKIKAAAPSTAVSKVKPAPATSTSGWSQSIFAGTAPKAGEWTCAVCDLKSPDSATKCTVCDAEKPTSKTKAVAMPAAASEFKPAPATSTSGWSKSLFATASSKSGEWTCTVCELKSSDSATKCTICDAAKPSLAASSVSASASASAPTNLDSATKCTVCDAEKPASESQISTTAQNQLAKQKASELASSQLPTFSFDLDFSKKPAFPGATTQSTLAAAALKQGEWTCSVCELKNPDSATKCTICDAMR
ncbi:hypothetical protein EDC05_000317 [Coemansia umbellata]|uniref:RanBP2-type domain-containing protein n=1 Tax=Coemansia umbellata TaxID=1424467 RepID=A0ABQ8PUZ0_9FUNG|nr:hypothetical protein EDC05_000317 [Coemansia umbellata]